MNTLIDAMFAYPPVMTFMYVALAVTENKLVTVTALEMTTFPVTFMES